MKKIIGRIQKVIKFIYIKLLLIFKTHNDNKHYILIEIYQKIIIAFLMIVYL